MASVERETLSRVKAAEPTLWVNGEGSPRQGTAAIAAAVDEAGRRLERSRTLLKTLFPAALNGVDDPLTSPLVEIGALSRVLAPDSAARGRWFAKCDHQLPIAGSIKARGGFHEVIAFAERAASQAGLITASEDLRGLARPECRALFANYTVVVGSTGNLGMGIGLVSAALGFKAVVHMSDDAKDWKKQRLRDHGATVVEHAGDYALAVENGRRAAEVDPFAHFVDDERSVDLFAGYAAAARELALQLASEKIAVDADHPLFVYLPCGVGGAPGGVTYGLKEIFGPDVHCFFAEPVQSPCMLVQLLHGDEPVSVYDIGLSNSTEADGLAVGQASMLVAPLMRDRIDGIYTVSDAQMLALLLETLRVADIFVEPSAASAFGGPAILTESRAGRAYLEARGLDGVMANATHVAWTTGGSLVPSAERERLTALAACAAPFDGRAF